MKMYCVKCKKSWEAKKTTKVKVGKRNAVTAVHTCGTKNYRFVK